MSLEYIYVARHGFRSNWVVDPATGDYKANFPTPTGIAADPALTAHGVDQARQLAAHLARRDGDGRGGRPVPVPIERIYSSPYYRCLETIRPFVETVQDAETEGGLMESRTILPSSAYPDSRKPWWAVRCDPGLVDWFGAAPFEQPQPAPVSLLRQKFFPWINSEYPHSEIVPRRHGETMAQLHARVAAVLEHIIQECDQDGVRAIVICSHAAPIIAMGRALTGDVPFAVETEDFGTFTCGLSVFHRRRRARSVQSDEKQCGFNGTDPSHVLPWDDQFQTVSNEPWTGGRGIGGGWDCDENCNCTFLADGEERGWRFSGDDESFAGSQQSKAKGPIVDSGLELGVVVQGRTTTETRLQGGKAEEEQEEEKKEEKKEKKEKEKEEEEVRGGKGTTEQSQTKDAEATVATTKEDAANDTNEHDVASREDGTDSTDSTGNTDSTGSTDKPSHARQGRKGPMPKL